MTFKEFIAAAKAKISAFYATKIGKIVIYGVIGTIIFLFGMTVGGATGCQMQKKHTKEAKIELAEKKVVVKQLQKEIVELEKAVTARDKLLTDKQKRKLAK
jgi:hypothetical protein